MVGLLAWLADLESKLGVNADWLRAVGVDLVQQVSGVGPWNVHN